MKIGLILLTVCLLASMASATTLSWGDVFLECKSDASYPECAAYFFLPSIPLKALRVLVWDSITNIKVIFEDWFTQAGEYLSDPEFSFTWFFGVVLTLALGWVSGLLSYVVGVGSGVLVFLIILGIRFSLFYLTLSSIYLLWLEVFHVKSDTLPFNRALVVGFVMVACSIYILVIDWGSALQSVVQS